jgi:REP element-mobilizing transposase RayT
MVRLESPGSLAHIMARGIDGHAIFSDNNDRAAFLMRLQLCLSECGFRCLAWCLMDNHYHLMVRTTEKPLSSLMRPLNSGYARWFNEKYGRRGYLFQDRFKSVLCQDQEYARQLIRYIHLNPVRDGKVRSLALLASWKWCGHGHLLGIRSACGKEFQDRLEALRRFGGSPKQAVAAYLSFCAEGIDEHNLDKAGELSEVEAIEITGSHKGWPAVVGDHDFARQAMEHHLAVARRKHRQADYHKALAEIAKRVCAEYAITEDNLHQRGWKETRSAARSVFCYRAHFEELIPLSVIANFMKITIPPVLLLARQGRSACQKPQKTK